MDIGEKLSRSVDISERITPVLQSRLQTATERFRERVQKATQGMQPAAAGWSAWPQYALDCAQRAVIFWDTLRQRGNNYLEHVQQGQPPVLHFQYEMVLDGRTLERPVNYALRAHHPARGRERRSAAPPVHHHRPARRPRPRHRRLQGRLAGRRGAARRPPGLLRHLLPRSGARADAARRVRGRARVRAQGARAASGEPQARDRRQLPGRLGRDDARRRGPRRDRAARDRWRADVVLGRCLARRRRRQPDALRRRHPRRHLARLALGRPGQRQVRRRPPGAELRVPESGQHLRRQVLQGVRERRQRAAALSRVRALVGRLLPARTARRSNGSPATCSSATSCGRAR